MLLLAALMLMLVLMFVVVLHMLLVYRMKVRLHIVQPVNPEGWLTILEGGGLLGRSSRPTRPPLLFLRTVQPQLCRRRRVLLL